MGSNLIVFFTTFCLFLIEALIHFNIGHKGKKFVWPSRKDLFYIIATVSLFSLLNSGLVWAIEKYWLG